MTTANPYKHYGSNSPYYDDFDASKNYVRQLFNPAMAIQARELTQSQTILQNQLSALGAYTFNDGDTVNGGNISVSYKQPVMKINPYDVNGNQIENTDIVGKTYIGETSGQRIVVTDSYGDRWILFSYLGAELTDGENFTEVVTSGVGDFTMETGSQGTALVATCTSGTIFIDGHFPTINAETIVVDITPDYNAIYNLGYKITRNVITSQIDGSLNDPAAGYTNYNAPGADRYQILPSLFGYKTGESTDTENSTDFIVSMIIQNEKVLQDQLTSASGTLTDVLAKRTYDESGSYSVTPWKVQLEETENDDNYICSIQSGSGYIQGYYVNNLVSQKVTNTKPRTSNPKTDTVQYYTGGVYAPILMTDDGYPSGKGVPSFSQGETVQVMSEPDGAGTILGECNIIDVYKEGTSFYVYLSEVSSVRSVFNGGKSIRSKMNPDSFILNLYINEYGFAELNGSDTPIIVQSPYYMMKETDLSSIEYETTRVYTTTAVGKSLTISDADTTVNFTSSSGLVAIYNSSTGTHINTYGVSFVPDNSSSVSLATISGSGIIDGNSYKIIVRVDRIGISARAKIAKFFTETVNVSSGSDIGYLSKEDIISLVSCVQTSNISDTSITDSVHTSLNLNNGQTDYIYEYGSVSGFSSLGNISNIASPTSYSVSYYYYEHAGEGCFTASSYVTDTNSETLSSLYSDIYSSIPSFRGKTNDIVYTLRDCLDFRIKRSEIETFRHSYLSPKTQVRYSCSVYLPRIDALWVSKSGTFGITEGIPSENPSAPASPDGTMTLYYLQNTAYVNKITSDVVLSYQNRQRYKMKDIAKLEDRIANTEDVLSMTLLETSASDMQILDAEGYNKYKSGIFADNFSSFDNSDYTSSDWNCTIDALEESVRCLFNADNFPFELNMSTSTNIVCEDVCAHLPFETYVFVENSYASEVTNIQKLMFYTWIGNLTLTPSIDTWVNDLGQFVVQDTYKKTAKPPTMFNSWSTNSSSTYYTGTAGWDQYSHTTTTTTTYTATTTYTGAWEYSTTNVLETIVNQDEFMRTLEVAYTAEGLRQGMKVNATMDGIVLDISSNIVDSDGKLSGTFVIPNNMPCGTKLVSFVDADKTSTADAYYTANGVTTWQNVENVYIRTWTPSTVTSSTTNSSSVSRYLDPVAQSFYIDNDTGLYIDSIDVFFAKKDENVNVQLHIVSMSNGYPTDSVATFSYVTLTPDDIPINNTDSDEVKLNTPATFKFKNPIYLSPYEEYAFVLMTPSYNYEVYTSTLGAADLTTGIGIAEQPYVGSMFLSQNARTWTAEQMSDIKFRINACKFDTSISGSARFNLKVQEEEFKVAIENLVSNVYMPSGTYANFSYRWQNDSVFTEFTNAETINELTERTIGTEVSALEIKIDLSTENENVTPMIDTEQVYGIFVNNIVEAIDNESNFNAGTYISLPISLQNSADDLRVIMDVITPSSSSVKVSYKTSEYQPLYIDHASVGTFGTSSEYSEDSVGKSMRLYYYNSDTYQLEPKSDVEVSGYIDRKIYLKSVGNPDEFKSVETYTDYQYSGLDAKYSDLVLLPVLSDENIDMKEWSSGSDYVSGEYVYYLGVIYQATTNADSSMKPSEYSSTWTRIESLRTSSETLLEETVIWREMSEETSTYTSSSSDETTFIERTYKPTIESESEFDSFVVRIDMFSRNAIDVPRVKNLRAIAVI